MESIAQVGRRTWFCRTFYEYKTYSGLKALEVILKNLGFVCIRIRFSWGSSPIYSGTGCAIRITCDDSYIFIYIARMVMKDYM